MNSQDPTRQEHLPDREEDSQPDSSVPTEDDFEVSFVEENGPDFEDERDPQRSPEWRLNPWMSIWTWPRVTIQEILEVNPRYMVAFLAAVTGISNGFFEAQMRHLGDQIPFNTILQAALIFGPISGLIGIYLLGFLLWWVSNKWNGSATPEEVRAAIAWANLPILLITVLWIPKLILFKQENFTSEKPRINANPNLGSYWAFFEMFEGLMGIWSIILLVGCLSYIFGFSIPKTMGTVLLTFLVLLVLSALLFQLGTTLALAA